MPKEVVEADGDATKRVIGSGPFIFDKLRQGHLVQRQEEPELLPQGRAARRRVSSALIIPDDATAMAGLRGKELDFYQVAQQNLDSLKKTNPEIQLVEWEFLLHPVHLLEASTSRRSTTPRVRQAVSMALDRDEVINVIYNGRGNWNNAIPWALSEWWLDPRGPDMGPTAKYFKYDPAEAKKLLAAAGFPDGLKVDMISTPGYGQVWVQQVELIAAAAQEGRHRRDASRCRSTRPTSAPRSRASSRAATRWSSGWRRRSPSRTTSCSTCTTRRGRAITPASTIPS